MLRRAVGTLYFLKFDNEEMYGNTTVQDGTEELQTLAFCKPAGLVGDGQLRRGGRAHLRTEMSTISPA